MLVNKILPPRSPRQWFGDLFTLLLLFGAFYAIWIGSHALFTPDEGRYSEVAREMVTTGDYITPRLNGVVFLDKPVLYYWLQAAAIQLFGLKEWALRFWPALFGVLGCLMTYTSGRLLYNRRTGFLAGIILATSPLYYGAAHYANLDLEVAVLVGCSLLSFITGIQATTKKIGHFFLILAYVFAGLAALTKGLIGIVFPAMIIGAWILLLNRWGTLKRMHLILGLAIFTAMVLPWYILVQKANPEFFQFFFVKQQVSRFLTTDHFNNRTTSWFYIPIVLAGIFPWCIFVVQAIAQQLKSVWQNKQAHAVELFLLLWLFLIFIFFSIPKSKTVGYILPIFPVLALMIGHYLNQCWENSKSRGITFGINGYLFLCAAISITCLSAPYIPAFDINHGMHPYLTINAIIFALSGTAMLFLKPKNLAQYFAVITVSACAFLLVISACSGIINEKSIKPLALELKQQIQPNDEVIAFYKYFQDLPIYLERRITIVADWNSPTIPLNDNWVRELWYGMPFQDTKEWLISDATFWQRWESNKRLFVFTDTNSYDTLKKHSKTPVFKIAQYNRVVILSNQANLTKNPNLTEGKGNQGQDS